jgi:thioesterase domain-containing protein
MIPADFVWLPALPLTPTGKVDRRALVSMQPIPRDAAKPFQAPKTALEALLAEMWEEVLDMRPIGVTDHFFHLGGDSLQAASLFVHIKQRLGRSLPNATLFENPTIERLALAIRREDAGKASLVAIQEGGSKSPLFCVHCGKGSVFHFYKLARLLGPDQPVYGLQPRGMGGGQILDRSVEDMAAHYVKEILVHQPDGPYFLAGYSFGGLVAFEMAQQLRKQGSKVAFLGLFDSSLPAARFRAENLRQRSRSIAKLAWRDLLATLGGTALGNVRTLLYKNSAFARDLPKWTRCQYARALGRPVPLELEDYHYFHQIAQPSRHAYRPRTYPDRVVLFRADDAAQCADLGWGPFAADLIIEPLAGPHEKMMQTPEVDVVAEKLNRHLEAAQANTRT